MSARLNPFARALRWLDRRIDARIAAAETAAREIYVGRYNCATGRTEWARHRDGASAADIEIDGERYFIRQIVGRPSVLVQARTGVEVPLPFAELAPARQRGSHAQ